MNSINDIIDMHHSEGELEDAYVNIHLDETILKLNTYTLTFTSNQAEKGETKIWNRAINEEIRKDRNLTREIKEFRLLFDVLGKLKIKKGYIQKSERPDFVLQKEGKSYGIEMTQIYSGHDWAVDKIREDIKNYNLEKEDIPGYIEYRKYHNKIQTFQIKESIVFEPIRDANKKQELQVKLKNKIFEKVRKMFDEYGSYDVNLVIANIVSPEYLEDLKEIDSFFQELKFYLSHLEVDTTQREYMLVLKIKNKLIQFHFSKNEFFVL